MSTALLERAVGYTLSAVDTVTPELISRPTPCSGWDLNMLLTHVCASVSALREGLDCERVRLFPVDEDPIADPAAELRIRVIGLLEAWPPRFESSGVHVADGWLPPAMLTGVAAIELAVHGWDISQSTGHCDLIPTALACDLLALSRTVIPDGNRRRLFAPAIPLSEPAGSDEELLAFLGRQAAHGPVQRRG